MTAQIEGMRRPDLVLLASEFPDLVEARRRRGRFRISRKWHACSPRSRAAVVANDRPTSTAVDPSSPPAFEGGKDYPKLSLLRFGRQCAICSTKQLFAGVRC